MASDRADEIGRNPAGLGNAKGVLEAAVGREVFGRAKREREFFNHYADPEEIPDEVLIVSENPEIPAEVEQLVPRLEGRRVCDFGCGYGITSAYFALRGAATFAFDVSEVNISVAKRTARVNGVERGVFLQVMQGECLSFSANSFDLVFGKGVLHHLELRLAAREIYRVLKPGGVAVFLDPFGENWLLEWARRCPLRSPKHRHTPDERSLLYSDIETLRSVFEQVTFRETGLFTVMKSVFRKVEVGMVAIPRWQGFLRRLGRLDEWILRRLPMARPLAQYIVICMFKPNDSAEMARRAVAT